MKIQRISALKIKERTTAGRTSAVLIRVVPPRCSVPCGEERPGRFYIGAIGNETAFSGREVLALSGICRVTGDFYDPGETGKTEETVETVDSDGYG